MLITSSAERNAKYRREQELKRAMFALGNPTVDQKYITDFGNSASKFISDSAKGVSGVAFGQSQQVLDRYNAQAQRLKYQKLVIEDFLERNAEKGSYTELQNALNNIQKDIDNVGNAYINTHNMMSQYKTEDEYNRDKITSQHVGSTYDEILAEITRLGEEQKNQTPETAAETQKSRDVLNNLLYNNNYIERDSYQKAIADIDRQIVEIEKTIGKPPVGMVARSVYDAKNGEAANKINYLKTLKSTLEEKEKITEFTELPAKLGEHNFQIGVSNGKIKGQYNPTADQLRQWMQKYVDSSYDEQMKMFDEKPEIVDPLGFIEQNPDLWVQEGPNSRLSNIFLTEIYNHAKEYHWDEITPEEKDIYYFTLNRLGKDKAIEYLSLLERYFGQRYAADITKSIEEFTDKAGWLGGTFINIALIPVSMIGNAEAALTGFGDYVSGEGINPYSSANRLRLGTTAIRSGTAKEWGKAADWELFGKNVFEQSFNILMSTGESLFGGLALGPAYMFFAGSGAAMSTAQDIYDRGGSANQVFFGALASGIAEAVFEKISIDRLLSGAESITGFKEMFKQILTQGGVETSEEVLTEMANTISDNLIMAEKSTVSLRVKELMDENPSMTLTEARKKAETEVVAEVIWAGLSGFISGGLNIGVIGTTGIVANKFDQKKQSVATQQIIGNQLKSDGTAEAFINFAISQGLVKDGTTVDSLSSEALGKVYQDFCDKFYETASKSKTSAELLSVVEKYNTEETPNVVKRYVGAVTATILAEHPEWAPETSEATTVDVDSVVDDSAGGVESAEESVLPNVSAAAPEADPIKDDAFAARGLERLTEEQRLLKSIGETLGRKVEFRNLDKWVKDPETGKRRRVSPGGMINKTTGVLYLNSSKYANQNALREVLKHEITHFAEVDTEAYALLQKGIMDSHVFKDWVKRKGYKGTVNEDGYAVSATSNMNAAYIKRYAESGLEGTEVFKGKDAEDAANREMVADFVTENLFTDKMSKLRDALSDVQPEAVSKFKQWILDLLKKLKNAFRSQAKVYESIEGIESEFVKVCKSAQRIWEQNHKQTAEQQKTSTESGGQYSLNEIQPISDQEYQELEKHFGTTDSFRVAGYLLIDGKLLDFSGKHWGDTTSRTRQVDHRDVSEVLNRGNNGIDDMVDMIGNGNIRLMPETGGINLAVYPNEKQRRVLSQYINYMLNTEGEVVIDYDAVGGDTVYSKAYGRTATSRQILNDISNYFNGARQSELMSFHTADDIQFSLPSNALEDRVSGDDLLNAQDLIEEIESVGGAVDENGYVTVYHRTTENAKEKILSTGKMSAKEDGVFFSTKRDGQIEGYGNAVVEMKIPVERLVLDDIFDDEAHLRYSLKNRNAMLDVSDYIIEPESKQYSLPQEVEEEYMSAVESGDTEAQSRLVEFAAKNAGDDEGNVIPLSERFNPQNEDLRYSLPDNKDRLLEMYEAGQITKEQLFEALENKPQRENPASIAKLKPEDASTTPELKKKTGENKGDSESKFYESAMKSSIFDESFKNDIKDDTYIQSYNRITNKETLKKAADMLDEGGQAGVTAWFAKPLDTVSLTDIAMGLILMDRYQRVGDYQSAAAAAQRVRMMGTSSGQQVQIFSILGRFTPEGMVHYAQKELDQAYQKFIDTKAKKWAEKNADKFKLTPEDIEKIRRNTLQATALPEDSRARAILLAEICSLVQNKIPPTFADSIRAWQRTAMLLNLRTNIRNILGNAGMTPVFIASDFFGTFVDKAIARTTGVRTTGNFSIKGSGKAFAKGFYESLDDFRRDVHTRQEELNRFELDGFKGREAPGKNFNAGTRFAVWNKMADILNGLDRFTSFCLEAGDRTFFEMWVNNSLNNQMRLNNVTEPTPEMLLVATEEALQRTWQDNSQMARVVSKLKQTMNIANIGGYGLGDVLVKFTKTPPNIAKAIVDFSPVGFIFATKNIVQIRQAFEKGQLTPAMQNKAVKSMSNAITGTLIYLLITALASAGVIRLSGDSDDDKDVSNFERYIVGIPPYSMEFFGVNITYDWMQPFGSVLAIVSEYMENKKDKSTGWGDDLVQAAMAGGEVFTKQSFLQSLYEFFSNSDENFIMGLSQAVASDPSVFIPQLISQTASIIDPKRRMTYDNNFWKNSLNQVISKIPGLRMLLPEQVNVMGETIENNQFLNPWLAFVAPYNTYPDSYGKTAEKIYDLYKTTGDKEVIPRSAPKNFSVKGHKYSFTQKQKQEFQRDMGQASAEMLDIFFKSKEYQKLNDAQKVDVIKSIYGYSTKLAKFNVVKNDYDYALLSDIIGYKDEEETQPILTKSKYDSLSQKAKIQIVEEGIFTTKERALKNYNEAVKYFISKTK